MATLLLLTNAMQPSAEVLPALGLLGHSVRVAPMEISALLDTAPVDAVLVVSLVGDKDAAIQHLGIMLAIRAQLLLRAGDTPSSAAGEASRDCARVWSRVW